MKHTTRKRSFIVIALAAVTGLTLTAGSCSDGPEESTAQGKKIKELGDYQEQAEKKAPYPAKEMTDPLARKNIRDRLIRLNNPNAISYVYRWSRDGELLGYYQIKGQLTHIGAQLNPTDTIIDGCNSTEYCPMLVQAAGDDNVYGDNGDGWFGFTAEGVMVTIMGGDVDQYDAPLDYPGVKDLTPKKR